MSGVQQTSERIPRRWEELVSSIVSVASHSSAPPQLVPAGEEPLTYRLLTGPDDAEFCRRVSAALATGYDLHGAPSLTFDGQRVVAGQALVYRTPPETDAVRLGEIQSFLIDYFDALYTQDLSAFDRVFHPSATLYSQQDGVTVVRPLREYRGIVAGRASPASVRQPRDEAVLMIDLLSDCMALAKVRLRLFDNIMEDHLNMIRTEAGWSIIAKTFTRVGSAAKLAEV